MPLGNCRTVPSPFALFFAIFAPFRWQIRWSLYVLYHICSKIDRIDILTLSKFCKQRNRQQSIHKGCPVGGFLIDMYGMYDVFQSLRNRTYRTYRTRWYQVLRKSSYCCLHDFCPARCQNTPSDQSGDRSASWKENWERVSVWG